MRPKAAGGRLLCDASAWTPYQRPLYYLVKE